MKLIEGFDHLGLDNIDNSDMLIYGFSGSGKTNFAIHYAMRYLHEGYEVVMFSDDPTSNYVVDIMTNYRNVVPNNAKINIFNDPDGITSNSIIDTIKAYDWDKNKKYVLIFDVVSIPRSGIEYRSFRDAYRSLTNSNSKSITIRQATRMNIDSAINYYDSIIENCGLVVFLERFEENKKTIKVIKSRHGSETNTIIYAYKDDKRNSLKFIKKLTNREEKYKSARVPNIFTRFINKTISIWTKIITKS